MIQTRFGTCGRAKTVPIPRAATACEINEANLDGTPKHIGVRENRARDLWQGYGLFPWTLAKPDGTIGCNLIKKMRRGN